MGPANSIPETTAEAGDNLKRIYVEKVAASSAFARAEQLRRLLVWLARRSLDNLPHPTEYEVACAALRRPENFDPQTDSLVRREMSRLRIKIREYYAQEGKDDAIRIRVAGPYHLAFDVIASRVTSLDRDPKRGLCLLVLPLYASSGMTDQAEMFYGELLTQLSSLSGFELVAQTTARGHARQLGDARSLAGQTGADFIIEGTARDSSDGLIVTLWLVDGQTGRARILCRLTGSDVEDLARRAAAALPLSPLQESIKSGAD
jgi:TolB-like protein